jgi:asparagine synthetase B (glutamine-hydrolysing)
MFLALVHAGGIDAARRLVGRATALEREPDALTTTVHGVLAGWHGAATLDVGTRSVVEGWLDAPLSAEQLRHFEFDRDLARAGGDFALATVDEDRLIVASGPGGGHRPVFVVVREEWVAASTRMRLLLALLDDRPPLDLDYMAAAVIVEYPSASDETPFVGIRQLPLGEAWLLRPGKREERRSVFLDPPRDEARGSERDHAHALREAVEHAVIRATRGVARVGVALSGGLDSSSVMLTLDSLRQAGRVDVELEAYSWEFEAPEAGDDRPYRRAIERKVGAPVHPIAPPDAAPYARRGMVLDAMPCTDPPCGLWLALDGAARRTGVNRLLTGVGGDNVLEGNPDLLGDLARKGKPVEALRKAIQLRGMWDSSPWWRVDRFILRPLLRPFAPAVLQAFRGRRQRRQWFGWMGARFGPWLRQREARPPIVPRITLESSPGERYVALAKMPFIADIALLRAQQEGASQYHRADPLFDDEVVRLVATLPPLSLLAGGYRRGLLRVAMSDLMPKSVRMRTDKAYMDPALAQMVRAAGGFEALEDLARAWRLADLKLVEPRRFREQFDRLARDPLNTLWCSVWPVLACEEFLRQYDEGWIL